MENNVTTEVEGVWEGTRHKCARVEIMEIRYVLMEMLMRK